jgi:hypothetical protein
MAQHNFYPSVGTNSTPYYVPLTDPPDVTRPGQGYFSLQVSGAQAAFTGGFWESAKRLIVSSQVNLHLDDEQGLGAQSLQGILAYRALRKNEATQLGFSQMLVDFVPATMKRVSVSLKYSVDTSNSLSKLAVIIDNKDLLSVVSLNPGAALVAETISKLSGRLIDAFLPPEERKAILEFSGDFDLTESGLKEGYYIILGSHDARNPLPAVPSPKFEVGEGGQLVADGKPVTQLSYVVLRATCVDAVRDRYAGKSAWRTKIQEAKQLAQDYADDTLAGGDSSARRALWETRCLPLLREAHTLLLADPNFLSTEVELIYRNAFRECQAIIADRQRVRGTTIGRDLIGRNLAGDENADRDYLGIPRDEDLDERLSTYAGQLYRARPKLQRLGLI